MAVAKKIGTFLGSVFIGLLAWPQAGSAHLKRRPEIMISNFGFRLVTTQDGWKNTPLPPEKNDLVYIFRSEKIFEGIQGSLTVRRQPLENESVTLERYAKKYIDDFPKFGFTVLESKQILIQNEPAYWVETQQAKSLKRMRQTIFVRDGQAIIFTCADHKKHFIDAINECQKVISTFKWTTSHPKVF